MLRYLVLLLILSTPVRACDLALLLAVDVSGSVDAQEYRVQIDGLALALRDGIVADALVQQRAKVSLVQWTGSTRQRQTVPWTAIRSHADVAALADTIANDPRIWRNYSTAIGEALVVSRLAFAPVADCTRKVIDLSGDGVSNEGIAPATQRAALDAANITVNALAIETDQTDLTGYFFENLITGPGAFVVTANGFADYPETIKRKLQRETSKQVTWLDKP
jgi:Ca-activated chloride channel family protein